MSHNQTFIITQNLIERLNNRLLSSSIHQLFCISVFLSISPLSVPDNLQWHFSRLRVLLGKPCEVRQMAGLSVRTSCPAASPAVWSRGTHLRAGVPASHQ